MTATTNTNTNTPPRAGNRSVTEDMLHDARNNGVERCAGCGKALSPDAVASEYVARGVRLTWCRSCANGQRELALEKRPGPFPASAAPHLHPKALRAAIKHFNRGELG